LHRTTLELMQLNSYVSGLFPDYGDQRSGM
jgi:hypothetical protein